ncbi:hypothetical protein Adt_23070 [Abeliophyllum distichum]|uniref:Uncharacterized protein n=1 Tax=Abeliophyllum distichum TaxID=126358 RepID=A0ABD1SA82_9LAMI
MRAKYEIELKAAKDCLKQARDQKRTTEDSQKHAEEAQKLAEDQTLTTETALATANSSLESVVTEKKKSLTVAKQELERVRAEQADIEAKIEKSYQDVFVDMPEYQDLAQCLMSIGEEQLVERIMETHPEWDIHFFRQAPTEVPAYEAVPGDKCDGAEDQTIPLVVEEGPQCADP